MVEGKKRMLLFGPGYGHNVEEKLQSLKDTEFFEVDFITNQFDESFKVKYPSIKYIPSKFSIKISKPLRSITSFFWLYGKVRHNGHYDVVYSLGTGGIMGALIFFFAHKNVKRAFEIWNIRVLDNANRNRSLSEKLDRYVVNRADLFCQYWWGIKEYFVNLFPEYEHKFLMYQLSYSDIFFSGERHYPESNFVKEFLSKIPSNQIVCFWPRSFIPSNNHALLLESLGDIKRRKPYLMENFKLYLWGGNVQREYSRRLIEESIRLYSLMQNVEIVDHPFVPQNDIFAIEERSDFFVQIANDDILSTFIMEILCSGKPFALSNLRTFQFLNEKYDLNIDFVDNNVQDISSRIDMILTMLRDSSITIDYGRREKCRKCFSRQNTKPSAQILYEKL